MAVRFHAAHAVITCQEVGCSFEADGRWSTTEPDGTAAAVRQAQAHANETGHILDYDRTEIKEVLPTSSRKDR